MFSKKPGQYVYSRSWGSKQLVQDTLICYRCSLSYQYTGINKVMPIKYKNKFECM